MSRRPGSLSTERIDAIDSIGAQAWDALVGRDDPFLEHGFLSALEDSGAVGAGTAWVPEHVVARRDGRLAGAIPFYRKLDSYGEFIFDWQWADAYHRAGISYYPKGVAAAPFTPVTGPRLLVHPDEPFEGVAAALVAGLREAAEAHDLSGVHILFAPEDQHRLLTAEGFLPRLSYQFHWLNRGYTCFEDFLADLRSGKRKEIRKERRSVADYGLHIEVVEGEAIRDSHVDAMWRFYRSTHARKWGEAYLNRATFELLVERCRSHLVLVMASDAGRWVAGTLNLRKGAGLYGRYWGCSRDYPGLHFECCYYRLIEYAISRGLALFEAGAQGEHKFLRGFAARPTFSNHWLRHPSASAAIERYLIEERARTEAVIAQYNRVSPLKHVRAASA